MASTYLQRTVSSAGNQKKWTFSAWLKKNSIGADAGIFGFTENATNYFRLRFKGGDNIQIDNDYGDTLTMNLRTNALYRDTNAWYHIVVAYDSAQATDTNRVKLWVNNEQVTSWDSPSYPAQNANTRLGNSGSNIELGRTTGSQFFNGVMSHVHYCDGYAYAPSDFGETDSTTGQWKIKTSPSGLSYGTNGFWWLKDSIATTDHSSNSNTFTVGGGTLTKTEDCPSNVFATMNPLVKSTGIFSQGNNTMTTTNTNWSTVPSTLGATSGKYYWEVKANLIAGSTLYNMIGFLRYQGNSSDVGNNDSLNLRDCNGIGIYSQNGNVYYSGGDSSYASTYSNGNIIGVALDLDNNFAYWSINGTWQNSGVPTSGSTGTGGYNISSFADGSFIFPASSTQYYGSSHKSENQYNFGNGYFGTTAVTTNSGNGYAGAEGASKFNYQPPTGYSALNTKGLNL